MHNDLVIQELGPFPTLSSDESVIADRSSFVSNRHVLGNGHGTKFVSSGARGSTESGVSASSLLLRDRSAIGVGQSDGDDVVEDTLALLRAEDAAV